MKDDTPLPCNALTLSFTSCNMGTYKLAIDVTRAKGLGEKNQFIGITSKLEFNSSLVGVIKYLARKTCYLNS